MHSGCVEDAFESVGSVISIFVPWPEKNPNRVLQTERHDRIYLTFKDFREMDV